MDVIGTHKAEGDQYFKIKDYELAVNSYSVAITISEDTGCENQLHVLYSNRSAARLALKDYTRALADAQRSLAVNDKWIKGWYRTAKALQGLGDIDLAAQAAQCAQELEPHSKEVAALLQELHQYQQSKAGTAAAVAACTSSSSSHSIHQLLQQAAQQQTLHKQQKQKLQQPKASLNLQLLPQQLVAGSKFLPSPDGVNSNLLLLLHGLGDRPAAFTALAQRMQLPQTACLALSGPLKVPETEGGRAWFTAFDEDWNLIQPRSGEKRRLNSLADSVKLLEQQLLPTLSAAGGWQPDQLQLLGFSQGGTVALEMAQRCPTGNRRLGGVVAVSASLLEEGLGHEGGSATNSCSSSSSSYGTTAEAAANPANADDRGTPVLVTHGDCDNVVPRNLINRSVAALQRSGCSVQVHNLPGKGHAMVDSAVEMRVLMAFWAQHLHSRPSDQSFVEVPGRFSDAAAAAAGGAAAAAAAAALSSGA